MHPTVASAAVFYPADLLRSLTQNQREYKDGSFKLQSEKDFLKMVSQRKTYGVQIMLFLLTSPFDSAHRLSDIKVFAAFTLA